MSPKALWLYFYVTFLTNDCKTILSIKHYYCIVVWIMEYHSTKYRTKKDTVNSMKTSCRTHSIICSSYVKMKNNQIFNESNMWWGVLTRAYFNLMWDQFHVWVPVHIGMIIDYESMNRKTFMKTSWLHKDYSQPQNGYPQNKCWICEVESDHIVCMWTQNNRTRVHILLNNIIWTCAWPRVHILLDSIIWELFHI